MKVVWKGKRKVSVPNVGEFKPDEPTAVLDNVGNELLSAGFVRYERPKPNKKKDKGG